MESRTYIKNIAISPKKLRFLVSDVKKLEPAESLDYLLYMPKKSARVLYKVIRSAIANARTTLKVSEDVLKFKTLTVEEGNKLKRYRAGARGMVRPYNKRFSHVKVVLHES
jgi:large subunit ribosomal protein L22